VKHLLTGICDHEQYVSSNATWWWNPWTMENYAGIMLFFAMNTCGLTQTWNSSIKHWFFCFNKLNSSIEHCDLIWFNRWKMQHGNESVIIWGSNLDVRGKWWDSKWHICVHAYTHMNINIDINIRTSILNYTHIYIYISTTTLRFWFCPFF